MRARSTVKFVETMLQSVVMRATDAGRRTAASVKAWSRPVKAGARLGVARDLVRSRRQLIADNALLRQQLVVLERSVERPRFRKQDKIILVALSRVNDAWQDGLHVVQPDTLLRWHREMFRRVWWWKSRPKKRRPRIALDAIALIKRIAKNNRVWGAERIRGELSKLGVQVSKRTVQKYTENARRPGPAGQTWRTFLDNHAGQIWACDFLQTYDVFFRPIFLFFIVEHGRRQVIHAGVTRHPTAAWVAQQLREATPFGEGPRFIIRDNDAKFGKRSTGDFDRVAETSGIGVVHTPPRSPWCNAICERFLGSVRRECLDHIVILSENHLRDVANEYVRYFNRSRPHQGIGQQLPDASDGRRSNANTDGNVVEIPVLGGLHHEYRRAA